MLARAREHLERLDREEAARPTDSTQMDLFPAPPDPVREALERLDPDALTPREALDWLYRLKERL